MREEDRGETWPPIPEWADVDDLAPDVRRDLRGLSKEGAEFVAQHLVTAGTLADEDPDLAWRHARAARQKGGRIAVVRETVGLVAYRAGEWSEAISELRAARRMGGGPGHLAVMADCERALGHPEKAIELSRSAEAAELDDDGRIEMTVVVAGARADLGQLDAAMVMLEGAGVQDEGADARLLYAYADLLAGAGRSTDALNWFMKAYDADVDDDTDAADRIAELADSTSGDTDSAADDADADDSDDDDPDDTDDSAEDADDPDDTEESDDVDDPEVDVSDGAQDDADDPEVDADDPDPDLDDSGDQDNAGLDEAEAAASEESDASDNSEGRREGDDEDEDEPDRRPDGDPDPDADPEDDGSEGPERP